MLTGLTPTSSAVGMLEPVTMTRSAVAAAPVAGTTFPCASRATGAGASGEGEGEGPMRADMGGLPCAGRLDTMAKKIASRTALLRDKPHSGSWALFIYLFSLIRRILKTPASVQFFFYFFFNLGRCLYNCHNNQPTKPSKRIQLMQHVVRRCSAKHIGDDVLNFVLLFSPRSWRQLASHKKLRIQ